MSDENAPASFTITPCGCPINSGGTVVHTPGCPFNVLNQDQEIYETSPAPMYGWVCPNCGMAKSPFTSQCCRKPQYTITSSGMLEET